MSDSKRILLKKGTCITLSRNPEGTSRQNWTILGVVPGGEGGSSICYEAALGSKQGRLKEFYPGDLSINGRDWMFHFQRTAEHQLQPIGQAMQSRFDEMCREFLGAYQMLEDAKREGPDRQLLNNYMPAYEILYGVGSDGKRGSIYIWTPDDKQGKNFGEYLSEVRANPGKLPEHKLYNILNALISLAGCIRLLHNADLLHLDIKPSNFLVLYDASFNINPHSISLFDVNTLYSIYSTYPRVTGTPGYRAPEVAEGEACLGSDIYSIGAMLYQAIVISKGLSPLYDPERYWDLEQLVSGSDLIQASESNSNVYLRDRLTTILRRTLAPRADDRYECCEELIADLEKARAYLVPDIFSDYLGMQQKLAILDSEDPKDCNPTAVMQDLLFRHALYETVGEQEPNINVLLLGAGTYGQKFLDICLQAGQVVGHGLRITACSNQPEVDRRLYLQPRPALSKFVNINGSMGKLSHLGYGELNFCPIPAAGEFIPGAVEKNRQALQAIVSACPGGERYHYVFIALGDDGLNRDIAGLLSDLPECENTVVNFVLRAGEAPMNCKGNPVLINRSITTRAIDPNLDRMGFNTHLSWESSLNLDMKRAREKYRNKYNQASSLAYVLSIRSKLASVGIYETDPVRAAALFQEKIVNNRNGSAKELFQRLVALEHRRWVLEKVTSGWQPIEKLGASPNYAALARRGITKDNAARRHPCLVFSDASTPLASFTREQWDTPGAHDQALDELDRMSVELHRAFLTLAKQLLSAQPLKKLNLDAIRQKLAGAPDPVITQFERYQLCLKNLLEGNQNYSRLFASYESELRTALEQLEPALRKDISARLDLIRQSVVCVVESNLCKDYKKLDEILVMKIPFILTYQVGPYMAMAFDDGRLENGKNSVVFANVASATVINPHKISYLYYFDRHSSVSLLTRKVRSVLNYFTRRGMHCQVAFHLAFDQRISMETREKTKSAFEKLLAETRLESVKFYSPADREEAAEMLMGALSGKRIDLFDCSVPLFASPRNNQMFLEYVTGRYPNFEFDWKEKQFHGTDRCSYLRYIEDNAFIRIDDMFALMNAEDNRHYYPEFAEVYQDLWRVYTGEAYLTGPYAFTNGVNNWNRLCTQLEAFTKTNDYVCKFSFPVDEHLPRTTHQFYLPDYMYAPLEKVLNRFRKLGVVLDSSGVVSCNSDTCLLTVHTEHNIQRELDAVINILYDQADISGLEVDGFTAWDREQRCNAQVISVRCDKLTVRNMTLDNVYSQKVLAALSRLHLINQFTDNGDPVRPVVSFRFTSPRMKKLLTTAGEILEVYTYYDIKKQGYFDDIATSFEFRWESGDITNELDCVLTKGFRSIIIECKSKRELSQDYYYKLWSIAEQFGLGTRKVLIANTYDTNTAGVVADNALNRTRGKQLGIITISDPQEIRNIGATLRSILEGTYHQDF